MKAIILAAGYATRLYPLTENFPKMIIQYLEENKAEGFVTKEEELKKIETKNLSERVVESRKLMRLATVMKKLEESGYVSVERTGRYTS